MQILCASDLVSFTNKGQAEASSSEPAKANAFGDGETYSFSVAKNNIWRERQMPWTRVYT